MSTQRIKKQSVDAVDDQNKQTMKPNGAEQPVIHQSNSRLRNSVLGTRNLMTVAAIAVVSCVIAIPCNYIFAAVAVSPNGILVACGIMGVWYFAFAIPGAVVQKPGAIMVAALIVGIISTFTTPVGVSAIGGNLYGGFLVELGVALTLYRNWRWLGFGLSAVIFGGANGFAYASIMKISVGGGFAFAAAGISIASCLVGVGMVMLVVAGLNKAGVGSKLDQRKKL